MFLVDVNLVLALAFQAHIHHSAAKAWFDVLTERQICHFCRMTQQGFLRLATNPKAFGDEAVTLSRAWELYDAFLSDPRISFMEEPAGVETIWRDYTRGQTFSPKVWNDAYLAAFARAANLQLVTFDHGFVQFANLNCVMLS
jgi:toxin-antitoxin system PIN domain toxin